MLDATLPLFPSAPVVASRPGKVAINRVQSDDLPIHRWYRFVLAFPPHLVRDYMGRFGIGAGATLLDPFCGTGTTLVEAQLAGAQAVGCEANPVPHLASHVKTDWAVAPDQVRAAADACASLARVRIVAARKLRTLPHEAAALLLDGSICPVPLHKALTLREAIEEAVPPDVLGHARLALARVLVADASNLHFGPEVGVRGRREDADVIGAWLRAMHEMADDLATLPGRESRRANVLHGDARQAVGSLEPGSIDAVFTSPPYPNEKDYTRTTRLETVVLGYATDKAGMRRIKRTLLRSNTRGVYADDEDGAWVARHARVQGICAEIERRRVTMGKTSGFERQYARVTQLYFGGMARHLTALRPALRPGAMLGYVVGDQASYLRVMIRTGEILGEIAEELGYQVASLDLFRTRFATATRAEMREEVLVLRWPGTAVIGPAR